MKRDYRPANQPTVTPTECDLAWTAGIVDGEGCISLTKRKVNYGHGMLHQLSLVVVNTDARMPSRLNDLFGGGQFIYSPAKQNKRQAWGWRVYNRRAAAVLQAIMPYLVIKKEEANIAIAFAGTVQDSGPIRLSQDVLDARDALTTRLRLLKNHREVA